MDLGLWGCFKVENLIKDSPLYMYFFIIYKAEKNINKPCHVCLRTPFVNHISLVLKQNSSHFKNKNPKNQNRAYKNNLDLKFLGFFWK